MLIVRFTNIVSPNLAFRMVPSVVTMNLPLPALNNIERSFLRRLGLDSSIPVTFDWEVVE